jgi:hypothetical protein
MGDRRDSSCVRSHEIEEPGATQLQLIDETE